MERDSPLKQWARKISPSKSRNKPLPPAPKQTINDPLESPTRAPPRSAAAKVQQPHEQGQTVSGQRKSSISKMRHLFSSGSKDQVRRSPPPQRPVTKEPYQRSKTPDVLSSTSRSAVSKDHIRRHSTLSPGSLTSRILALESELATTKRDLARFQDYDQDDRGSRHPQNRGIDYDREVEARYRRLVGQGHLDGLMETLMSSPERRLLESGLAWGARNNYSHSFAEDDALFHEPNQQQQQQQRNRLSHKSRAVSAPHAVSDFQSRESILSAQQSRAEAELKELRTKMRQAAWEQVQSQARAQLHRQANLHGAFTFSESERPRSRGKERSVSAPHDPSLRYDDPSAKPALRRVQGPLKKELPALPEEGPNNGGNARSSGPSKETRSSIRAVSAPMEDTGVDSPNEYQRQSDFVFPASSHAEGLSLSEASSEDHGSKDREEAKGRKSHRRRPSERDITFLHENKKPRTDIQDQGHKDTLQNQHGADEGYSDALLPSGTDRYGARNHHEQDPGHRNRGKAPLGESTVSNVLPNSAGPRKEAEAKPVEEENTIDLDALSTPTKTRSSSQGRDEENVYTYHDDDGGDESLELGPPDTRPPSPERRHLPRPTRLETVREDFEWDDEIF